MGLCLRQPLTTGGLGGWHTNAVRPHPKRTKSHNTRPAQLDPPDKRLSTTTKFAIRPSQSKWSTFRKPAGRTASPRSATSTPSTRSPSTRLERPPCSPRVSVVTTGSRAVMVVRPSPSSTRRPRPPRRSSFVLSALLARPRSSFL